MRLAALHMDLLGNELLLLLNDAPGSDLLGSNLLGSDLLGSNLAGSNLMGYDLLRHNPLYRRLGNVLHPDIFHSKGQFHVRDGTEGDRGLHREGEAAQDNAAVLCYDTLLRHRIKKKEKTTDGQQRTVE